MTMLPKRIHRLVEWHLRNAGNIRANAFAEAEALRKKANTQPPAPEVPIKGKGKHGDATGRKAQLLAEADRIMRQAPMWEAVARDTEAWCARTPSLRRFYGLYYSMGLDYGYIAGEMRVEKTTLYDWREKIVAYAALLAVEKGLVRMPKTTD